MQLDKANKIIRVSLLLVYPILAVMIWFIDFFKETPTANKIGISALLILYAGVRFYRLIKKTPNNNL